jgi:hypothetical protein
VYLCWQRIKEHLRIQRARVPERMEPVQVSRGLLRRQLPFLVLLMTLIVLGLALDGLVRRYGSDAASWLGVEHRLRDTFSRPSDDTVRNLLAAASAGTAAILGLVISISLIVWQATADRYRSTSIVAFLLRERTGRTVVQLLALGFAYSLWVLALLEIFGADRPYVSAAIALVLTTVAIVSLLSYREDGLVGYLPARIADRLVTEIGVNLGRAQQEGAGRSVENHARRIAASDLQIYEDLLHHLSAHGDSDDIAYCLGSLSSLLNYHLRSKKRFARDSPFFERRTERITAPTAGIEEAIVGRGLMHLTQPVPDHLWLERRVLEVVAEAAKPHLGSPEVADAAFKLWAEALQYAVAAEDPAAARLVFDEVRSLVDDPVVLDSASLSTQLLTFAWVTIEVTLGRGEVQAERIVDRQPWKESAKLRDLPWLAQEDARELGRRVSREVTVTGGVVTPTQVMVTEVRRWRERRRRDDDAALVDDAVALCRAHLKAATVSPAQPAAAAAAVTFIQVLSRLAHHRRSPGDMTGLAVQLVAAWIAADEEEANDLRQDTGRAARVFAEIEEWPAAIELLRASAVINSLVRGQETDAGRVTTLLFDGLYTVATVYGWAEFHRADQTRDLITILQMIVGDLDRLAELLERGPLTLMLPTVTYHHWLQSLLNAAHDLPDRYVQDGGIGYDVQKDHPSDLFRDADLLFGPEKCLQHLVDRALAERNELRAKLVTVLNEIRLARLG